MKATLLILLLATLSSAYVEVWFSHVAFNTSAVDVLLNTTSLGTIQPNDYSNLQNVTSGYYEVIVKDTATQTVLVNSSVTLEDGKRYTIFGTGASEHLEAVPLVDDLTAPVDSYTTRVRFFQAVSDVATAEILASGKVIATLNYKEATYVSLAAGTYEFAFQAKGGAAPLFKATFAIVGGYVYTFAPNGMVGHNFTSSTAVDIEYKYFSARVAHLSPDAPAVDVFLKDETTMVSNIFVSNQAFKVISEYKLVPYLANHVYSFVVTPHGQGNVTTGTAAVNVALGTFTINLFGLVTPGSKDSFQIGYQADNLAAPANALANKVRFFHAIPGAADVDLLMDGTALFSGIAFGTGTNFVNVPTGTHTFVLRSGTDNIVTASLQLVGGGVYTIYADGLAGDNHTHTPALTLNAAITYTYFEARATHAAPGIGAATMTLKDVHGVVVYQSPAISYGQFSDYVTLTVQKYTLEFGGSFVPVEFNRNAGEVVTVALMGTGTALSAPVFNDANGAPKGSAWARVRFIHAALNGPAVNVKFGNDELFKDIAFQHASEYAEIAAGTYFVTVFAADVNVLSLTHDFVGGGVYTVLAEGIVEHNTTFPINGVVHSDRAYQYFSLRATHASPDAGNVDLLLDDGYTSMTAFGNVAYGSSAGYTEFVLSAYTLKVTQAGKKDNVLIAVKPGFVANTYYTVAVIGETAVNTSTPLQVLVATDNNKAPETSQKAIVRFVHAVAGGAPNVDVYFNDLQTPLFPNVAYSKIVDGAVVVAGTYSVILYQAGTNTRLAAIDNFKIAGGQDITVVAMGTPASIAIKPETVNHFNYFQLRFVHSSFSVGVVSVLLEGQAVWSDIEPGKITAWAEFVSANHKNLTVVHNGVAVASRNQPFADSKGTTIILVGLNEVNSSTPVELLAKEESNSVAGSSTVALVRIVHTSPNTPPIELKFNETAQFNNVEYKQITDYKEITAGNYTLNIMTPSINHTIYEHSVEVLGGYTYTLYVEGLVSGLSVQQGIDYVPPMNGYFRFFHTSANTPAVDLTVDWIMNDAYRNIAFEGASSYQAYPAGAHDLRVLPTDKKDPILSQEQFTLATGSWNSVLFVGLSEFENHTSTLETIVIPDVATLPADGNVLVRFISASPNAPALALKANGAELFNNVTYKGYTDYHNFAADKYKIEVFETGSPNNILLGSDFDFQVSGGKSAIYTLIAEGIYGQPSFKILAFRDHGAAPPGEPSNPAGKKGLPAWAIGLIVAGVLVAVIAIAAGGFILYRRKRRAGYSEISTHDA